MNIFKLHNDLIFDIALFLGMGDMYNFLTTNKSFYYEIAKNNNYRIYSNNNKYYNKEFYLTFDSYKCIFEKLKIMKLGHLGSNLKIINKSNKLNVQNAKQLLICPCLFDMIINCQGVKHLYIWGCVNPHKSNLFPPINIDISLLKNLENLENLEIYYIKDCKLDLDLSQYPMLQKFNIIESTIKSITFSNKKYKYIKFENSYLIENEININTHFLNVKNYDENKTIILSKSELILNFSYDNALSPIEFYVLYIKLPTFILNSTVNFLSSYYDIHDNMIKNKTTNIDNIYIYDRYDDDDENYINEFPNKFPYIKYNKILLINNDDNFKEYSNDINNYDYQKKNTS